MVPLEQGDRVQEGTPPTKPHTSKPHPSHPAMLMGTETGQPLVGGAWSLYKPSSPTILLWTRFTKAPRDPAFGVLGPANPRISWASSHPQRFSLQRGGTHEQRRHFAPLPRRSQGPPV